MASTKLEFGIFKVCRSGVELLTKLNSCLQHLDVSLLLDGIGSHEVSLCWEPNTRTLLIDNKTLSHCYVQSRAIPIGQQDRLYPDQTLSFKESGSPLLRLSILDTKERKHSDDDENPENALSKKRHSEDNKEDVDEVKKKLEVFQGTMKTNAPKKPLQQMTLSASSSSKEYVLKAPSSNAMSANWVDTGAVLVRHTSDIVGSSKIAAFDMDSTIVETKSGYAYPHDPDDWKILFPQVGVKLKAFHSDGYKIVVFSNQRGVQKGKIKKSDIMRKFDNIAAELGLPMQMFVSVGDDMMRKPRVGMWNLLCDEWNDGIAPDMKDSFYVGDAAGRKDAPRKHKKDHSCGDLLFSLNIGIQFHLPEPFYLNKPGGTINLPNFNPVVLVKKPPPLTEPHDALDIAESHLEVIVMVGWPASGKSQFCQRNFVPRKYKHVSRDVLQSWQKCVELCRTSLASGMNVVIDNTNLDEGSRRRYIDCVTSVTTSKPVRIRCFQMNVSFEHAQHNEKFRELMGEKHEKINPIIYNRLKTSYKEPQLTEGFHSIVKANFVPQFMDEKGRVLYQQYLLER